MAKILRYKDVVEKTGISKPTLYRMIDEGLFPKPFEISPRANKKSKHAIVGFLEDDIDEWIMRKYHGRT